MLCVGLDPDPGLLPEHLTRERPLAEAVMVFNLALIEATSASACCYKLNLGFYEALGAPGWEVFKQTVTAARRKHLVIADGKRGDIGNTARFYAEAVFGWSACDACTLSPYLGRDAVQPFLAYPDRAAFVLVRTSNAGAHEIQELDCGGKPLYLRTAALAAQWSDGEPGTLGFVLGATQPAAVGQVREAHPEIPLLLPGIGAQGGDAAALFTALAVGTGPIIVNSSRQIIYASSDQDFAEAAEREAESMRASLERARSASNH